MIRKLTLAMAAALLAAPALAAEPIEGKWVRGDTGAVIQFSACGGSSYCGTVLTGAHKGKSIGKLSGSGGSYSGSVIAVDDGDKKYTGKASITGNRMKLSGCVMGIICKGETWTKQ